MWARSLPGAPLAIIPIYWEIQQEAQALPACFVFVFLLCMWRGRVWGWRRRWDEGKAEARAPTSVPDFKGEPSLLFLGLSWQSPRSACCLPRTRAEEDAQVCLVASEDAGDDSRDEERDKAPDTVSRHAEQATCCTLALPVTLSSLPLS